MKCTKVKNPCKICFQSVTKKNGLQCQGACKKWAHYKCLNYTPGKIQDIKAGYIKVTCPCPDCSTLEAKEILVEPPFTCTNTQCPANKLPVCASVECPSKENIPMYPPPPFSEYSPGISPRALGPNSKKCPIKITSSSHKVKSESQQKNNPNTSKGNPISKCSSSQIYLKPRKKSSPCPPSCSSQQIIKIGNRKPCSPKQSKSCSNLSSSSCTGKRQCEHIRAISSDSQVRNICMDQKMLFKAIENLCNTVGQLSNQLKDLMCRINETTVIQ